ncbi:MAG: hypothetical protein CMJ32_03050 [Phycisphaerae bacterium]|nr:hypothetical protein [Phycisphaerae bacterium]
MDKDGRSVHNRPIGRLHVDAQQHGLTWSATRNVHLKSYRGPDRSGVHDAMVVTLHMHTHHDISNRECSNTT